MQPAARSNKMSRYKITEDLETTPTADFHLARNVKKDEIVLMKILKKNYYTLEECKGNKEVQVCLKLNHANVLKFVEFINDSNQLLMIFEYIPDNVKRVMKRRDQPFSEAETKGIMLQVFHGLSYIHGQGFIHRNLRPELLVCNEDATEVKISDFSLARSSLDTINTIADYTGQLHPYLPPEVLLQVEKYGTPVDMWAAGCVMAELLTGSPLFQSDVMEIKDLMSKICVIIGTFTKGEWQEGSQALRQAMFNLPKVEVGRGLGEAGAKVGADAKGLIMDLVVWNPSKRKTADQAIRDDFFKSDGEFVNSTENQEILKFAREKMQTWRETYQADLTRNSLAEFDRIIADVTHKAGHQPQRNPFQGFETSNPLLGDSTPRGKFGSPPQQRKLGVKGGADDPFGQFRPQRLQMDLSPRKSEKNPFTEEIKSREEHRRSHQGPPANKDSLFAPEEPPKNVDHRDRADKMRQQNYLKYRTKYGDDFLRSQLGDKLASNEKETVAPSNNRKGSVAQDRGQSRDPVRTRSPPKQAFNGKGGSDADYDLDINLDFGEKSETELNKAEWLRGPKSPKNNTNSYRGNKPQENGLPAIKEKSAPRVSPSRRLPESDVKYAPIDHASKAARLREQNLVKYRDKYGDDDMKKIMGGGGNDGAINSKTYADAKHGNYTPSWMDNGSGTRAF